ncbi:MAG: 50S ribosomal protein L6 [Polyangiaceae bacterium UTPRO1]|jgi:large subunit ribosomal protein L6|nr:50S ribosomal protein L6 [Myxococcales bacterium]OQY65893.1 MAG: 50S ribosomal protein L6 [Polyangiaceae bacterium UTPRO1]
MSRIGKQPITVPSGVTIAVEPGAVKVKGPKGTLAAAVSPLVEIRVQDGTINVARREDSSAARSVHGLTRKLVANMVTGVSDGFRRVLEINGVGYRAEAKGSAIQFALGYSHPIVFPLPEGVQAKIDKQTVVTLEGADRQVLGETAAAIRKLRPPEPYKGKGIKYAEEKIRRKAGKAVGASS